MAKRRMFSLDVVDSDKFLDMPASTQNLYFHLGMRADDDGFVSSPKKITSIVNCSVDDYKLLLAKGYIIPFDSGICVIKDWKINNYIQSDRYTPSLYTAEKQLLFSAPNKPYELTKRQCIQDVYETDTQVRLGKLSIDSYAAKPQKQKNFFKPTVEDIDEYCTERNNGIDAQYFFDFYEANGWTQGKGKQIKNWKAAVRLWERNKSKHVQTSGTEQARVKGVDYL